MDRKQLEDCLVASKINKEAYYLYGGLPNEKCCLEELNGIWSVYYSERGIKTSLKKFETESEACEYFYDWINHDESAKLLPETKAAQ